MALGVEGGPGYDIPLLKADDKNGGDEVRPSPAVVVFVSPDC